MEFESVKFEPYWLEEKDWLVTSVSVDLNDEEDRAYCGEWIGYLFGYSFVTNTRCVALVGDPSTVVYELLFSFKDAKTKRQFLALVDGNEITRVEPELWLVPTAGEIRDARPLAQVIPEDIILRAKIIAARILSAYDDSGRYN